MPHQRWQHLSETWNPSTSSKRPTICQLTHKLHIFQAQMPSQTLLSFMICRFSPSSHSSYYRNFLAGAPSTAAVFFLRFLLHVLLLHSSVECFMHNSMVGIPRPSSHPLEKGSFIFLQLWALGYTTDTSGLSITIPQLLPLSLPSPAPPQVVVCLFSFLLDRICIVMGNLSNYLVVI